MNRAKQPKKVRTFRTSLGHELMAMLRAGCRRNAKNKKAYNRKRDRAIPRD